MKIVLKSNRDIIQPDWGFLCYFTGMFCFYQNMYFQLFIQMFIIGYVFIKKLQQNVQQNKIKIKLKYTTMSDILFVSIWLGVLLLMLYISRKTYAVFIYPDSKTILVLFRIMVIGMVTIYYCDNTPTALSVLESMAIATFAMCVLILLITPPSAYFTASAESGFGAKISQHRNQVGAMTASMFLASYYLHKYSKFKIGYALAAFFVFITILSGSRGAMLQLGMEVILVFLFNGDFFKLFFFLLGLGAAVLVIRYVPVLYDNVWVRFMNAAESVTTGSDADSSALGREMYKEIAWIMFQERPFRGWGVDGFKGYLAYHPYYNGYYLPARYSHCNYTEIATSTGIVGLLGWYLPTFYMLIKSVFNWKKSKNIEFTLIWLFVLIILDYARIPWASHLGTYPYFGLYIVMRCSLRDVKLNKKPKQKIGAKNGTTNEPAMADKTV